MQCIIQGCENEGVNNFGVRLRRQNASAIWAPNTEAYICDFHASRGLRVIVFLEPTEHSELETIVRSVSQPTSRTTRITHTPSD